MAEVTSELPYEVLKLIQADTSQLRFDMRDIKQRMTGVEEGLAGVNRRLDRIEDRVE
jgi:hypothetical protein